VVISSTQSLENLWANIYRDSISVDYVINYIKACLVLSAALMSCKNMSGETSLEKLLASMAPALIDGEYVFCSFEKANYGDHAGLEPIASFAEAEGLTLVIPVSRADEQGLAYEAVFRGITLKVHSSLEAVGLTAAFSKKLTEHGISANVIAGYFHDHIFVQAEHAENAIAALNELSR